jgi:hypothetical protein
MKETMNQHDKRTDRVGSRRCTSKDTLVSNRPDDGAATASRAGLHASHQKLILAYLDAYGAGSLLPPQFLGLTRLGMRFLRGCMKRYA